MGVCILGMGDCEQRTETRTDVLNESINTTIKNNMTKQMQKNVATAQQVNAIKIITGEDLHMSDINLKIFSTISLDSLQKIANEQELKAMLEQAANNAIDKEVIAEKGFLSGQQYTGDIQNIKNIVKNHMEQNTTVEQVNQCIASAYNQNVITAEVGGNATLQAINMEIVSNVAAKCIAEQASKDITENVALQTAINNLNSKIAADASGPLDVITDSIGAFGNIFTSVAGVIIIIAILALVGFLIFFLWPNRGVSPSPQQVAKQIARQAGGGFNFTKTFKGLDKFLGNFL